MSYHVFRMIDSLLEEHEQGSSELEMTATVH
jgi:hypothetical protein